VRGTGSESRQGRCGTRIREVHVNWLCGAAHSVWLDAPVTGDQHDLTLRLGQDELRVRGVYETVSIVNDVMVALWFVVGSVLFFSESTTTAGTWFFLVGSVQLLIRPVIRLSRRVHLGRIAPERSASSARDF